MFKKLLSLFLLWTLLLQLVPAIAPETQAATPYTDADWQKLLQNYKDFFVGGENVDWSDSEIQSIIAKTNSSGITISGISYWCGKYWRDLDANRSNTQRIFGTEDITLQVSCGKIRSQFIYIRQMAQGYGTKGSVYTYKDANGQKVTVNLYQNAELRDAIFYALGKSTAFYTYELYLEKSKMGTAGWWDWAHGTPVEALQALMIMYPYTTAEEARIANQITDTCLKLINKIRPNNTGKYDQKTLEYRRTRLHVCTMIAALTSDTELMEETRENLAFYMTENYDTIDGVKPDGSYVLHLYWPMEGTYGTDVLISRIIDTYSCLAGTAFAMEDSDILVDWITETFAPVMHKGVIMTPFNGRYPYNGKSYGLIVLRGALQLIGCFDAKADLNLKQFVRSVVLEDNAEETRKSYESIAVSLANVSLLQTLKSVVVDSNIPASDYEYAAMRYYTDRAVQHRGDYTVALSMSSTRIAIPETINGCNRYGWYGGDGALYVYNDNTDYSNDQYGRTVQNYANMYRVAGTTEEDSSLRQPWNNRKPYFPGMTYSYDSSTKTDVWTQEKNKDGVDAASFVGGVELGGKYIAAAMDFEAYSWSEEEHAEELSTKLAFEQRNDCKQVLESDLTAKKSYFMFDDEIVCVGSDIDFSTRDTVINTYVDNRQLLETATVNGIKVIGTEDIYVDGILLEKVKEFDAPLSYSNPKWVHQENFGGYYFPNGGEVYVNKTFRQSTNDGDNSNDDYNNILLGEGIANVSYSAFELWISHGTKPADGSYSYVMLPEKSVAETESYTKNPDIKILKNTTSLHVVQEKTLGITAMVFWKAGTYGDIAVDKPMIVMVQEKDGKYLLSASDPTQKLTSGKITIKRALTATKLDSEITVSGSGNTVVSINFSQCGGKTVSAEFTTETQPKQLMFDFNSKTAAKYQSEVYGFIDYSKASNWATAYPEQTVKVSDGMLVLPLTTRVNADGTPVDYNTNIEPSDSNTNFAWSGDGTKANFLNFDPSSAEIFQVRFKLENATQYGNYAQGIYLNYLPTGASEWSASSNSEYNEVIKIAIDDACLDGGSLDGQYVTVTASLKNRKLLSCESISGLRIHFGYLRGGTATIDYIYIGPKTESLYFGFENDGGTNRYNEAAYGGHNFDSVASSPWATAVTDQVGKYFTVDNEEGTLSLYTSCDYYGTLGKNENYGAYLATSAHSGAFGWVGNTNRHALSYDASNAEIMEIRFKTDGIVAQDGKTPKLIMLTNVETNGVTTSDYTSEIPFALTDGEYQTVRIPITDSVKAADYIKMLGVRFCYTKAVTEGSVGKITVDYIYVGKKINAPSNLYFGFEDTKTDQERYASDVYGNTQFDRGNWWLSGECDSMRLTNGAMSITADAQLADTTWPAVYFKTAVNGASSSYPLNFNPEQAEYFQIRFKLKNFRVGDQTAANGTKTVQPYLKLTYFEAGSTTSVSATSDYKEFKSYINADKYITVTLPVNDAMRNAEQISSIRVYFGGIESMEGTQGELTVDYIFVGRKADLPTPLYTVTFKNADGTVLTTQSVQKGETAVYSGTTPTKAYDANKHYSFKGWDKALTNITADTTVTATFTATAHSYTYSNVDATNHKATCSCGYSKTDGHNWNDGEITVQPTCTASGVKTYTCTDCGATKTEHVAKLNHTEVIDAAIAPTCTETGLTEGSHCETCGEVIVARGILDALGHSYKYADNSDKTHTVTCENCDYSEIADCVFENGECICGAKEIAEPIYDDAVKFSHSLTLENDISINFIGLGSALSVYDSFYLECKVPVYSGNELTGYEIVNIEPVYNGKNYEFTLLGVTAKMMNDDIEAVFRMTKNGREYYSKTDVYSVAEYAYGKLNSTKESDTDELKAICANLLRYGALAQTQFGYRTDALVDSAMTDDHKAYLTDLATVEMKDYRKQLNDLDTVIVPWKSTTLELGNKVIMCLIANLANYTGDPSGLTMRLTYVDSNGLTVTEERPLERYNPDALTYAVSYDGLRATEMRSIVSAAIYNGDTRVSKTVEYSIESYGARSSDAAMQTLCFAMLAYGDAANAFFSK